ncbi:hypothetical protein HCB26_12860 [Listeria booriae]|uniref:Bacterial Ig domain-containing protein n=1 Tax=Listeria booriae TaxID=1552123 RepID=A0A7X0Z1E2_9LIST|nr:immunoglobulin-like domain-containing protein [Listeria booriae]MBC2167464.1 hypothetical protein [Listeria booriae]
MTQKIKGTLISIIILCLITISFPIQGIQAATTQDDYYKELSKIAKQVENEDHTPLASKVTWKFKWLVFTDVTFNQENATPEHRTLDKNDQLYAKVVADDFKKSLEAANPNILVDIDLEIYTTPIQVTTANNDFILHESQIAGVLEAKVPYGAYDSIFALSDSLGGGGVTKATYYSDITRGAAYSGVGLSKLYVNNYPAHSTDRKIEYSTDIALHEFCHQMQMAGLIDSYPDVHGSTTYGYTNDPKNGWMQFYLDYLTGNVKDPTSGKLIGVYPEMWRLTPRYLQEITPEIRGATWIFKPAGVANQLIDGLDKMYISIDYKNAYNSPWFDIYFQAGTEKIDPTKIKADNTDILQVLNFDGGVARTKITGAGETKLHFETKDASSTYTKTVVVYDEKGAMEAVNALFESNDTTKSIKNETNQQTIDAAQKLVDFLPASLATKPQQAIDKAQKELDAKKVAKPVFPVVKADNKTILIKGAPNAEITLTLADKTKVTKTANTAGEATFPVSNLKAGDTIMAIQTVAGVTSEAATTIVQASALTAPTIDKYVVGDNYVTGQAPANAKKVSLYKDGKIVRNAVVNEDGTYSIWGKDALTAAGQTFEVYSIDAAGAIGNKATAIVQAKTTDIATKPTIDGYVLGSSYITGTVGANTKKIALYTNDQLIRYGAVNEDGTYKIWGKDALTKAGQTFEIRPVDAKGIEGQKAIATVKYATTVTIDDYYLKTAYVTGTASEGTKRIALIINNEIVRYGAVAADGTYKVYASDFLLTANQSFQVVPYDDSNFAGAAKESTVKTKAVPIKIGAPTIDNYNLGTSYVTGTTVTGTKRVALYTNDALVRYAAVAEDGTYKIWGKDALTAVSQAFEIRPYAANSLEGIAATSTVK